MSDQPGEQSPPAYPPPPYSPPAYPPSYPAYPPPYYAHPAYYPAYYPVYAQPPRPAHPHPVPREYHQILRTWDYAWWRPLLGLLSFVVGAFLVVGVATFVLAALATLWDDRSYSEILTALGEMTTSTEIGPTELLLLNLSLAILIPLTWLLVRTIHRLRPRWLSSVVPRLRWKFLAICLGLAAVALLAQIVVSLFLPDGSNPDLEGKTNAFTTQTAWLVAIVLLTTPLQAAGEEYVFRGYLLQAIGSFVQRAWWRWVAITLTALLFAVAHGVQNFPLFFDRFMFGFIAGWLAIRTGGLESGIALHVLNNFLAFGFALAFGDLSESLNVAEVSWWNIFATLTQSGVYAALVVLVARRMNLQRRTKPPQRTETAEVLPTGFEPALPP